jgi:hypothetical protein
MLEVRDVEALDGYWLRLTLSDGRVIERDVSDALAGPVFEPVRSHRAIFEAAFVDAGSVAWPGDVDLAPETLIWGVSQARSTGTPPARMRVPRLTL